MTSVGMHEHEREKVRVTGVRGRRECRGEGEMGDLAGYPTEEVGRWIDG